MEPAVQLSLPLFDPPTFNALLQKRADGARLSVIVCPRRKNSWLVRVLPFSDKRELSVPRALAEAPEEIKNCLIEWALLPCRPRRRNRPAVRRQRALLEKKIRAYMESLPDAPRPASRFDPESVAGRNRGHTYDLREVFDTVNREYFNGSLAALVRWGKARTKMSYHIVKTDRRGNRHHLITIAGAYNHPDVPRFAIEAIMHHEMLHIAVPPREKNGRKEIHGREFTDREKIFPHYNEWRKWEREELPYMRFTKKSRRGAAGNLLRRLYGIFNH